MKKSCSCFLSYKESAQADPACMRCRGTGEYDSPIFPVDVTPLSGGAPRFHEILAELGALHDAKNHDYTSGGPPTGNFDRVADILAHYPDFPYWAPYGVALVYMLKQLDAALWMMCQGHSSRTGEGVPQRLRDVAAYAILAEVLWEKEGAA